MCDESQQFGMKRQIVECPILYSVGPTVEYMPDVGGLPDDALMLQRGYCAVCEIEVPRDYTIDEIGLKNILLVR